MPTTADILTAPHDEPILVHGDNWIAYYADGPVGPAEFGCGNTEADAVAALIARGGSWCGERGAARAAS